MNYVKVARDTDIANGAIKAVDADGVKLLLTKIDGRLYATARKCPHMGADLCKGQVADGAIVCPRHGAAFALDSGKTVDPARILFLKTTPKPLATYSVKVDNGDVLVAVS